MAEVEEPQVKRVLLVHREVVSHVKENHGERGDRTSGLQAI